MTSGAEAFVLAFRHFHAGQFDVAEQQFRQILAQEPGHAAAHHLLGAIHFQKGRIGDAAACFRRAIALNPRVPDYHTNLGFAHRVQGQIDEAKACFQTALQLNPDSAEAHNGMGSVLERQDMLEEAVAHYQTALRLKSSLAPVWNNLGNVLARQEKYEEAVQGFQQAIRLQPVYPEAYWNLGNCLSQQSKFDKAIESFQQALKLKPDFVEAHNSLANVYSRQDKFADAIHWYGEALRIDPNSADAYHGLANCQERQHQTDEAIVNYQHTLRLDSGSAEAHNGYGCALQRLQMLEEAIQCYRNALHLKPNFAEAHNNLGTALQQQGRLDEAVRCYHEAVRLKPAYTKACTNLGKACQDLGQFDDAMARYESALRQDPNQPEANLGRALIWLVQGDWARGWPAYEWRLRQLGMDSKSAFPERLWDGSDFRGKTLLLHAEQGLGDTLQFIRYAPMVKQRGGTVLVQCQRQLMGLLGRAAGIDGLVALGDPPPAFDVQLPLPSLPRVFSTSVATIPSTGPYLQANPALVARWRLPGVQQSRPAVKDQDAGRRRVDFGRFRVGIVWQGNPDFGSDRQRSMALSEFAPLDQVEGVELFSLQVGPGVEQLLALASTTRITNLGSRFDPESLEDAAAVVMNLDLVVTVDTAMAHLAGALGVPVWVALPLAPDWRWLLEREDSPWYPTMRLFRQKQRGDWGDVMRRMAAALGEKARGGGT